ncbi:PREDICTED: THAP domain-containing protein 3-like [Vollenhovia emeryi]|uniref:THAP domain-containing protein 3-like n=1 Tax=Vollenhovia emeryi TaxID=411798 RepID=UPI0005F4C175|nr:PREDICTED: THAP domain-containing protein 3-like [Vollenhovia emeryi]
MRIYRSERDCTKMGGCWAEFCNNSSSKGYCMKVFPRNCKRRAIWTKNVGRKDCTPTNNSYLCEIHFAPEMWQQTLNGKRKLKKDAVPTVFGFFLKKEKVNYDISILLIKNSKSQGIEQKYLETTLQKNFNVFVWRYKINLFLV